ncbi:uncharacterized protein LOC110462261 [Mizuhopecten yessoensis]|uniref:Uncharacterized protein n=1 Tax=Mizuhopecten yessoensis TaxID=6573 RepID=A0A210PYM7_MIZYE|nr:uncharacterized protein LOC110462261 [Mizuhopecten yessoensis]OWF41539.1 hypothetical protein KP79_PYT11876 [Mizuhopecten yessoensis]
MLKSMEQEIDPIKFSIRDVNEDKFITISGINRYFLIGLNTEGNICSEDVSSEGTGEVCVPLVRLCISNTGGLTMAPGNKDLPCYIQGEVLQSEVNVISGTSVDVADKYLEICAGEFKKPRRKLPKTPGMATVSKPPPKPKRVLQTLSITEPEVEVKEKDHYLQGNWEVIQRPDVNSEILANLNSPAELGIMAASFLTKQIQQYTDVRLSIETTDAIFRFLQEVAHYQKGLLMAYLTETSEKLEEMPESERDRPMHRPAVKLLVELLRQILDPLSHVVLCVQLLRTFSHFPSNLTTMIQCQAFAAILGTMAVYLKDKQIQEYGLDILAHVATYRPNIRHKLPLRETGLEMILRSMNHHQTDENITLSGCRTLANLTSTLQEMLDNLLDLDSTPDINEAVEKYEKLLCHLFEHAIQVIQRSLQNFPDNITIKTDGRRFLFNYSKMTQITLKKKVWVQHRDTSPEVDSDGELTEDTASPVSVQDLTTPTTFLQVKSDDNNTKGILKHTVEGGDLTGPEKKVRFPDEDSEDSLASESSTDEEEDNDDEDDCAIGGDAVRQKLRKKVSRVDVCYGDEPILVVQKTELLSPEYFSTATDKDVDGVNSNGENDILDDSDDVFETCDKPNSESSHDGRRSGVDLTERSDDEPTGPVLVVNSTSGSGPGTLTSDATEAGKEDPGSTECPIDARATDEEVGDVSQSLVKAASPSPSHQVTGLSYSVADSPFLIKVIYLSIVNYLSGLVLGDRDSFALDILDHPLRFLTEKSGALPEILDFVNKQFEKSKTLMDVDPTFLISLIDCIRYKSLLFDLYKKSMLEVCSDLTETHSPKVTSWALATLVLVVKDTKTFSMLTDPSFSSQIYTVLTAAKSKLQHFPEIAQLQSIVQPSNS